MWTTAVNVATYTAGAVFTTLADSLVGPHLLATDVATDVTTDVATDVTMSGPDSRRGAAQTIGAYVPRSKDASAYAVRGFRTR